MIEEIKSIKSEKSDLRKFGLLIGIILIIIAGLLFWKEKESFQTFFIVGTLLCLLGLVIPTILKPIYWIWMFFGTILGWIMTRIILSFMFYLILTPIGLISRLFGKEFLELRMNKSKASYWNIRTNEHLKKENYEKQF